ncbi:MAG: glycerol kinase GlpK [bacterium]
MPPSFIVALDQGTTSSRAVLFGADGRIAGMAQRELTQHYPRPGWVEHAPQEIWESQRAMLEQVVREHGVAPSAIAGIGITNQRETTVVWDRKTGQPIHPAIVWQDRRCAAICEELKNRGLEAYVRQNTGLVLDPYFSGPKIKWILDQVDGARQRAVNGELLFGTIDTWLIWKLTGGAVHATDCSNASRTLLYNIREMKWDERLLEALDIPAAMLPDVRDSSGSFGTCICRGATIPILGVAGDQQAALFGQDCLATGQAKNTYGTGCFLLMNTGEQLCLSQNGLLSTIAWRIDGRVQYALEGSVLVAGAAVQWLRDGLQIIGSAAESEPLAREAGDAEDVYVVPAFAGLGAPHWDMYARGAIFGLTGGTTRAQLVKATLESLAFQTRDVLNAMQADTGIRLQALRVDGGAAANNLLMQFQADILGVAVERPQVIESTARGAACLAGIAAGIWDRDAMLSRRVLDRAFLPRMDAAHRQARCAQWERAVQRTRGWLS